MLRLAELILISCMALATLPGGWLGQTPRFLQWPGETSGAHPDWTSAADRLRKGAHRKGRLLPSLLAHYRMPTDARCAVVGFSAGSNSGCHELLRNSEDRDQIDAVCQIDGWHPMRRISPRSQATRDAFLAFDDQVEPLLDFANAVGASADRVYVQTTSQVASPNRGVMATWEAMPFLEILAVDSVPTRLRTPPGVPLGFPHRATHPKLKRGEPYPRPMAQAGVGGFSQLYYTGATKRAHQLQAWIVAQDVVREFVIPLWKAKEA